MLHVCAYRNMSKASTFRKGLCFDSSVVQGKTTNIHFLTRPMQSLEDFSGFQIYIFG